MAETLKLGNGDWATKEGSLLAYNNENGNYKPLPFDVTRASSATVLNKAGLIETVQSGVPRIDFSDDTNGALLTEPQSTNLITQSESFGNSYWTKSGASIEGDASTAGAEQVTNGDMEAALATINGISFIGYHSTSSQSTDQANSGTKSLKVTGTANIFTSYIIPNDASTAGKTYLITYAIYVPSTLTGSVDILTKEGGVQRIIETITNLDQWVNVSYYFNATDYTLDRPILSQALSGLSTEFYYIDNVSVKEVQGFTSPDGTANAFKLVEGTNNGGHNIQRVENVSNATIYTSSVFVKYGGREWIRFTDAQSSNRIHFNTLTGVFGTILGTVIDYNSTELGNGWYKLSLTTTSVTTAYALRVSLAETDNDVVYTGDGTSGIYIYGAQLELGYATSYIPTSGSTSTRLADVVTGAGDVNTFNSTEGVLFAEMAALSNDGTYKGISLSDGLTSNVVRFYTNPTENQLSIRVTVAGVHQFNVVYTLTDLTTYNKVALKYKANDFAFWVNGVEVKSYIGGTTFTSNTLNKLALSNGAGSDYFFGKTKQLQVFPTALTDSELAVLTT